MFPAKLIKLVKHAKQLHVWLHLRLSVSYILVEGSYLKLRVDEDQRAFQKVDQVTIYRLAYGASYRKLERPYAFWQRGG
jgi:hypothetical protein